MVVTAVQCDALAASLTTLQRGLEAVEAAIPFSCDREALNAAKLAYQRDETVVDAAIELAQCLAGQGRFGPRSCGARFCWSRTSPGWTRRRPRTTRPTTPVPSRSARPCQTLVIEPLFNGTEAPSSEDVDRGIAIAARLVENASSHNHSAVLLASKLKGVEGYWRGLCGASIKMQRPPPEATPDRLRAICALTKLSGGQQTDSFMEVAEVVARVLGADRAASLERGFAPHDLVRDFVKARDALAVRELCALVFPGGSSRNLCLATLRGRRRRRGGAGRADVARGAGRGGRRIFEGARRARAAAALYAVGRSRGGVLRWVGRGDAAPGGPPRGAPGAAPARRA